jgi:hypothetical protein
MACTAARRADTHSVDAAGRHSVLASDVVHAVENEHHGRGYSNVMYIGATAGCAKNSAYLVKQAAAFLSGKTPPDCAADNFEVDFRGRATEADLTPLGSSQMGLPPL